MDSHSLVYNIFFVHWDFHDNYCHDKSWSEFEFLDHMKQSSHSNATNDSHSLFDNNLDFELQYFVRYILYRNNFFYEIGRRHHKILSM